MVAADANYSLKGYFLLLLIVAFDILFVTVQVFEVRRTSFRKFCFTLHQNKCVAPVWLLF